MSESSRTAPYITFRLADDMFAVNVNQVREILDAGRITKIPRTPEFLRGVINVRGSVVPVVDMRLKFGMPAVENTANTRIIVLELDLDGEHLVLGGLADTVKDVIELPQDQIEAPPKIGSRWKTEFLKGIGKRNDEFIIILDADQVFSTEEIALADEISVKTKKEEYDEMA